MYFKQKSDVIFRNYHSFGYITDNRNFGYRIDGQQCIGDKILSESGAVFFSALEREAQTLDNICAKVCLHFQGIDPVTIMSDARAFYQLLEHDGFVVSGKTFHECEHNDQQAILNKYTSPSGKNSPRDIVQSQKSPQDFISQHFNKKPYLTNIQIEITSICNERCIHCYIPHENKTSSIDPQLFFNIIEQCNNMRILHLTLTGGEPMLHPDFCNFLAICRCYNYSVNVLSNLTLLTEQVVKEMKANPLLGVQTSLYSMDPDTHDAITKLPGSFHKTKKGILKIIENNIPLQISCPIMKQNKAHFSSVKQWAKEVGALPAVDPVIIAEYNNTKRNVTCRLDPQEIEEFLEIKASEDANFIEQIITEAKEKNSDSPNDAICSVCSSSACITEKGDVYPCAGWQGCVLGNVTQTPLQDIWNSSKKASYLRSLQKSNFPQCLQCADKDFCTMCMVRNANESSSGDPTEINRYFCNIARIRKKIASRIPLE